MDVLPAERKHEALVRAVLVLKNGGSVVVPTDTVYGLCADAKNPKAVCEIFTIKARPTTAPIPIFIAEWGMLDDVAYVDDTRVRKFLSCLWPGAVTAVLPSRGWMPLELRAGSLNIGVRIPDSALVQDLIRMFGGPLTATSANLSGREPAISAAEAVAQFGKMPVRPDFIIDGGVLPGTISTVVDCTQWPPTILRRGAIPDGKIFSYVKEADTN